MTRWKVELEPVKDWLQGLSQSGYEEAMGLIQFLSEVGPNGGRPYIGEIVNSKYKNLKELIGKGKLKNVRILFIFDPNQEAILLLAGNKEGQWKKWYEDNIPVAEKIYEDHLKKLKLGQQK